MNNQITIRPTVAEDVDPLIEWLMEPDILRWFPMYNFREVEDAARSWVHYYKLHSCLTAEHDNTPCGIANLYIQPYEKLKHQCLFAIIVSGKFRGKGIGTYLFQELEKLAIERFHIELLHLEVYENNPAIRLYSRLGFEECGRHDRFLKEVSGEYRAKILMQKMLPRQG